MAAQTAATTTARSTYGTKLYYYDTNAYKELIPIKDFPDLGGEPELLETTTLSDKNQTYIKGIQSMEGMTFTANYTKENFEKIQTLEAKKDLITFRLGFGDGSASEPTDCFYWKGEITCWVNGAGVDEVVSMTIFITPSTEITNKDPNAQAPTESK